MPTPCNIQPLRQVDLGPAAKLWEASVRATHHFLTNDDVVTMRPEVAALLPRMPSLFGAFDAAGTLLGICGMQNRNIDLLFVHPHAFRCGIGRMLLLHAMQFYEAQTVDVNEDNPGAIAFYLSVGFHVVSRSETDGAGRPFPILHLSL